MPWLSLILSDLLVDCRPRSGDCDLDLDCDLPLPASSSGRLWLLLGLPGGDEPVEAMIGLNAGFRTQNGVLRDLGVSQSFLRLGVA